MTNLAYDITIPKKIGESWVADLIPNEFYWLDSKTLHPNVKNDPEAGLIYIIATRKKVRFSSANQPKYSFFGHKLTIYLEIGEEKELRKVAIDTRKYNLINKPSVITTGKFIAFTPENGVKITFDIHDFLRCYAIDLGINTFIRNIKFSKGAMGESDTFHEIILDEDDDLFISTNHFKVTRLGADTYHNNNHSRFNSIIDKEGTILENCLQLYFNPIENRNRTIEIENNLLTISEEYDITNITIHFEMEQGTEYFKFYSKSVDEKECHLFTYEMQSTGVVLTAFRHP